MLTDFFVHYFWKTCDTVHIAQYVTSLSSALLFSFWSRNVKVRRSRSLKYWSESSRIYWWYLLPWFYIFFFFWHRQLVKLVEYCGRIDQGDRFFSWFFSWLIHLLGWEAPDIQFWPHGAKKIREEFEKVSNIHYWKLFDCILKCFVVSKMVKETYLLV